MLCAAHTSISRYQTVCASAILKANLHVGRRQPALHGDIFDRSYAGHFQHLFDASSDALERFLLLQRAGEHKSSISCHSIRHKRCQGCFLSVLMPSHMRNRA